MTWVLVSLCMNDDHGYESGQVVQVNIHDDDNDVELELESTRCTEEFDLVGPVCRWMPEYASKALKRVGKLRIGRLVFDVGGMRYHVGNIFWNSFLLKPRDVRRMLDYLLKRSGFSVTMAYCDTEWLPADERTNGATSQADGGAK